MEMEYKILDTELTRDFAGGLIGMTFKAIGFTKVDNDVNYIRLDTWDGELLFTEDEVQLVK